MTLGAPEVPGHHHPEAKRKSSVVGFEFGIVNAIPEPLAVVPTLSFRLRIENGSPVRVRSLALWCQIRIEPHLRSHPIEEQTKLLERFGESAHSGASLQSFLWTHASVNVPSFDRSTEIDLPVACTYDFDVAAARYLHALGEGEVPLRFLFSGTVFLEGGSSPRVEPIPWDREATYGLPVLTWRELMNIYFPGLAWIRIRHESLDALHRYRAENRLPDWDQTITALVGEAGSIAALRKLAGQS